MSAMPSSRRQQAARKGKTSRTGKPVRSVTHIPDSPSGVLGIPTVGLGGAPSAPPLERALSLLNATAFIDEKKVQMFDQDVLRAMRGLFPAGKVYSFDMFASTSVGTGSATYIATTLSISPAVVSYSEWSALSALFDEVRLVRSALAFLPLVGSNGQNMGSGSSGQLAISAIICGVNHDNISTSPATYAAVGRLAKSAHVIRCVGDTTGAVTFTCRPMRGLGWARVVTPAVQDPPAGVLGSFDLASDPSTPLSMTSVYYKNTLRTTLAFRNRA
jgi:hypothetical protein